MKWYTKAEVGERELYLDFTETSKYFCQARLDDLEKPGETRCKACNKEVNNWREHIILNCEVVPRSQLGDKYRS